MRQVAVALLHHPVLDRGGSVITTAITNLDVHDISRSCRTYGISDVFIVHPIEAQRQLVARVKSHWVDGAGAKRIPDRSDALDRVRIVSSLDEACEMFGGANNIELWTTAASARSAVSSYRSLRSTIAEDGKPVMLLFGTGWGLAPEVFDRASVRIEPILGVDPWNHLSVRAACAITLDRLLGTW